MTLRSAPPDTQREIDAILARLRVSIRTGERHWFVAVLEAAGQWPVAEEEVDGRSFRYLIGGEAFDWLLLAERICEALGDLVPLDEREALVQRCQLPIEVTEEEFRRVLGPAKHRAHLNFVYGVQVEEALQWGVAQEVHKERQCQVWRNGHVDDEVYSRIYGDGRQQLFQRFRQERGFDGERLSLSDLHEFTYWLFKHRVNSSDPARVASDTRKGLAVLARMRFARVT